MDFTELRPKVEILVREVLDQGEPLAGRDAAIARTLAIRNAVDDLREVLDSLDDEAAKVLADAGVITKRCAKCAHWMVVAERGRPRRYCSDDCKTAARAERP